MPHKAPSHSPKRWRSADSRPSAAKRGYGADWQRYRKWYLSQRQNILCAECHHALATVVDHRVPHQGDYDLFWDASNHQPLCKECHDRKTATQDGGFGHESKEASERARP